MKKLHTIAFYALTAPVLMLGAGSLLAQPAADQDRDRDREQQSTQSQQGASRSSPPGTEGNESIRRAGQTDPQVGAGNRSASDRSDSQVGAGNRSASDRANAQIGANSQAASNNAQNQNRGYIASAPANGMQANALIGAEVKTTGGEDVGPVDDLIIDENGQIVAIVVSVGGFLGLGQKDIAIGWDDVTMSGSADDQELQIDVTRAELSAAPEYESQDD